MSAYGVVHVCMERYGFEGLNSRHSDIGEGGGAIKLVLFERLPAPAGFPSLPTPNQLKKFSTGTGSGSKDQMRLGIYKRWGFEHKIGDVVDAYGLAQIARALVNPDMELIAPQREVIQAMRHPKGKKGDLPTAVHAEMPTQMRYDLGL